MYKLHLYKDTIYLDHLCKRILIQLPWTFGQKLTDMTASWIQFELKASTWPSSTKLEIEKVIFDI